MNGRIFVGTSGWSYGHWKGLFYPDDVCRSKWFSHYVRIFSTVEINYSFYRLPAPATLEKWRRETPDRFTFSMKASRFITHLKKLNVTKASLDPFFTRMRVMKEKLGPILYQLPPQMGKDIERLGRFARLLPGDMRHAIEFRNDSWLDEETLSLLDRHSICCCIVSAPRLQCMRRVTAPFVYIRMHGSKSWYRSKYGDEELAGWADFVCSALGEGNDVYVYFNNDYRAYAAHNAIALERMVRKRVGELE